ncbi:MAG: isoprenylcysteine carboxylmethyltransferase family protein [Methanomicrobia archaeon]|nr:isoprenylcysteine carboxylmethyltransferase family protein [Methanomicrobia archaeon]
MKKIQINAKRLGTIAHYIGVVSEYLLVIFLAVWLNNVLKLPSLFNFPFRMFGFILTVFGLFLIVWSCWLQFKIGQGSTGFSEPTQKLVTSGPYGIVRNPMMYGQFLFFAGLGFLLDLVTMFLLLPIVILAMHGFIVFIEEPNLKRRFSQEWTDYTEKVHRWFPRLSKKDNKHQERDINEKYVKEDLRFGEIDMEKVI